MQQVNNREIEVRFLEIDYPVLVVKLCEGGAEDLGEDFFEEIIFYDKELVWMYGEKKIVRLRKTKQGILLTFKGKLGGSDIESHEIEFGVDNIQKAKDFLEELGLVAFRQQEKKRHTFKLGEVMVDIDTWPSVPKYVELEGPSEESLKKAAGVLGFDWKDAILKSPRFIIEEKYGIPVSKLKFFTFSKIE